MNAFSEKKKHINIIDCIYQSPDTGSFSLYSFSRSLSACRARICYVGRSSAALLPGPSNCTHAQKCWASSGPCKSLSRVGGELYD